MLRLKTIRRIARVEPMEHHRSLYKESKISDGIKDNQLISGSEITRVSPIIVRKDRISVKIEKNWLHGWGRAIEASMIVV